ncbi:hypothetical protein PF324_24790 (plasmid) [Enterobacter hormaechei]|nr:hypothetical protein [Enterobacter hormaechei]WBT14891.1 hypothetical protein PF324_24790 [Enterobacter hormaechei]
MICSGAGRGDAERRFVPVLAVGMLERRFVPALAVGMLSGVLFRFWLWGC